MPEKEIFQRRYIGKDYVDWGNDLILNKDIAWKKISRRARRSILKARELKNLKIVKKEGTKEDADLFRTIWYNPNDPDIPENGFHQNQHVYFAYLDGEFVAGTIVTEVGPNLFLHFNGATEEAKNLQIPSLMIWNIVEQFHNSKFKYLDVGCSFREYLQDFFKNWATYEYPIIFHPPDLIPHINITPFDAQNMHIQPNPSVDVDKILQEKFNSPFTYFPSNKHAVFAVVKNLGLNNDDEIFITTTTGSPYIPSYVISGIEDVCQWNREITDKTKAIFIVHELGFPHSETKELRQLANYKKISLIEDCSYAWENDQTGNYVDYIIYSLPKFFPVQYGSILVGAHFDDQKIWDEFHCLDVQKRIITKQQLSSYIQNTEEISQKRIDNYRYLERLFVEEGFKPFFNLPSGMVPTVFVLKVESQDKTKLISSRLNFFGVECDTNYYNNAIVLPVHQNLSKPHLDYIFGAIHSMYREDCGVCPPEQLVNFSKTKDNKNAKPEKNWRPNT